jgi:hypothetical protein
MFKKIRMVVSLCALGALASTVGCGADIGSSGEEGELGLESVQQEIGEPMCGSMICNSANSCTALQINQCGPPSHAPVDLPPYGVPGCPQQTVAEDKTPPTNGGRILPVFQWRGATLTALNCTAAKVEAALYAKTGVAPVATLVGTEIYKGVWNGNVCTLTSPSAKPFVNANPQLKAVRSTVKATLGVALQPVTTGFWHVCG